MSARSPSFVLQKGQNRWVSNLTYVSLRTFGLSGFSRGTLAMQGSEPHPPIPTLVALNRHPHQEKTSTPNTKPQSIGDAKKLATGKKLYRNQ